MTGDEKVFSEFFYDAQLYQIHEIILPTSGLNRKRWESYDSIFILRRFRLSGLTIPYDK